MFLLKDIIANGGMTINKECESVKGTTGYQVSIQDMQIIKVRDLRKKSLIAMLDSLPAGSCLGVWIEKGLAYIDNSKLITNKKKAIDFGKAKKQISIYDWAKQEVVYL